jgi:hypothetical protein
MIIPINSYYFPKYYYMDGFRVMETLFSLWGAKWTRKYARNSDERQTSRSYFFNIWNTSSALSFCHLLDHRLSHSVAHSSRPSDVPPLSAGSKLSVVEPAERYTYPLSACQGWPDTGPSAPPQPQSKSLPPTHLRLNVTLSELPCSGITRACLKIYVMWQSNTTFTV